MNDNTYNYIWKEMIENEAKDILADLSIEFHNVILKDAKKKILTEYDRLRSYAKIEYLRDPEGYSNRYLVCSYLIMAIAKVSPLKVGKNDVNLTNEKLALRAGVRLLSLFKSYECKGEDGEIWRKHQIVDVVFDQLGEDYVESLCNYLFYDIEENTYSILELANIMWIIDAYLMVCYKSNQVIDILDKPQYTIERYVKDRFAYDKIWDSIWEDVIEKKAKRIVDNNIGEVVFDKSSKRLILKAMDKIYNDAKAKYVRLHNFAVDKFIFCSCLILAVAKVQPLEYKHDNHDLKGIYNENLAIEVGLSMLYYFTTEEMDFKRNQSRFKFPSAFQNKTYKELLCLMLYYDVEADHYSTLAIANILYLIVLYTKARNSSIRKTHDVVMTQLRMFLQRDGEGNYIEWKDGKIIHVLNNDERIATKRQDGCADDIQIDEISLFVGLDLQTQKMIYMINKGDNENMVYFLNLLNTDGGYNVEHRIRIILDKQEVFEKEGIKRYLEEGKNSERFIFLFNEEQGTWINMIEGFVYRMVKQNLEGLQANSEEELKTYIDKYVDDYNHELIKHLL